MSKTKNKKEWVAREEWSDKVKEIYEDAINKLNGDGAVLHWYGPSHIVWDDENWECANTSSEEFYNSIFDEQKKDYTKKQLKIAFESLVELSKLNYDEFYREDECCPHCGR